MKTVPEDRREKGHGAIHVLDRFHIIAYMSKDIDEVWAKETKKAEQRRLRVGAYKPPPMKKVARMLRAHRPLLLNWFHAKGVISSGVVEGFNKKVKLSIRKVYGF